MAIQLFGFEIKKSGTENKNPTDEQSVKSFAPPVNTDGAYETYPGGAYGFALNQDNTGKDDVDLINRYREMALQPECDSAVQDIINEAICFEPDNLPVEIMLDNVKIADNIKAKIKTEFEYILKLLKFKNEGYDIFRHWYVDGRLYYHLMIDLKKPREGLKEIRYLDPRKIKKVREPLLDRNIQTGEPVITRYREFYLYNPRGMNSTLQGIRVAPDAIVYLTSGITDTKRNNVLSFLHKAIKNYNQLRMLEDATIVYVLARAPERRIWYIDVGNLPKMKAEQYLKEMMNKHKNRLVYDSSSGEVRDDRKFMTMLEDYWLPRREGGKGTEVTTLPGSGSLTDNEQLTYFTKRLYKSLNVPVSRLEAEAQFNLGRSSEITRDELKFSKFIDRLRSRFSRLFDDILEIQLSLKGIMSREEWKEIKDDVYYDFLRDNHFTELKDNEILRERLEMASAADPFVGKYFPVSFVQTKILRFSEDEIKDFKKQMDKEQKEMDKMTMQQQAMGIGGDQGAGPGGPAGPPMAAPDPHPSDTVIPQQPQVKKPGIPQKKDDQNRKKMIKEIAEAAFLSRG